MSLLEPVLALSQANEKALQNELASIKEEMAKSRLGHVRNIKNLYKCINKKKRRINKMNMEAYHLKAMLAEAKSSAVSVRPENIRDYRYFAVDLVESVESVESVDSEDDSMLCENFAKKAKMM